MMPETVLALLVYLVFGVWLIWVFVDDTDLGNQSLRKLGPVVVLLVVMSATIWPLLLIASYLASRLRRSKGVA